MADSKCRVRIGRMCRKVALTALLIPFATLAYAAKPAVKPNLQAPAAQPRQRDRIEMTLIDPTGQDAARWHVKVGAVYDPQHLDEPGATRTTRSRANCRSGSPTLPVPSINVLPCESTVIDSHWVDLQESQVRRLGPAGLTLDFDRRLRFEDGGDYLPREIQVNITQCEADCPAWTQSLRIACLEQDPAGEQASEIYTEQFALRFVPAAQAGGGVTCAFRNGAHEGWHDRDTVMQRIRSRFGDEEAQMHLSLLSSFAVVPRHDRGWMPNRTFGWGDGPDLCQAPYDRVDAKQKLGPRSGWPYGGEVEVMVLRRKDGEVCSIWLDGDVRVGSLNERVRYFFEFSKGKFVQLRTQEPQSVQRRLAFIEGQPYEYVNKPKMSYGSGKTIFYWHRDAAREWPERLSETPDMKEFESAAKAAAALLQEFGSLPTTQSL